MHSVSHPRIKRGVRVSPSLAGHTTSDLGAGWGRGVLVPVCPREAVFLKVGRAGTLPWRWGNSAGPQSALALGRGRSRADRASMPTRGAMGTGHGHGQTEP